MSRRLLATALVLGALAGPVSDWAAAGTDPLVPEQAVSCAECGMSAKADGRFTSRLVQGGSTLYFCDIGDLAAFIERTHPKEYVASVHDFTSGEWIDASTAFYAIDKKVYSSPMGWGVAAFRDRPAGTGAPLDFEALRKALR